jgi:hypothetical protein
MGAPQIIMIVLITLNVANAVFNHGKTREHNGLSTLLIDMPITVGLLYWGGFFG